MEGRGRDRWREGEKIYELGMQHIRELGRVNSRSEHAVLLLSVSSTGASRPSQCPQSLSVCGRLFAAWLIRDMCSFPPKYVHSRIYAYASPPLCRSSDQSLCSLPSYYYPPPLCPHRSPFTRLFPYSLSYFHHSSPYVSPLSRPFSTRISPLPSHLSNLPSFQLHPSYSSPLP